MQTSHWHLNQAVRTLDAGGVIAYPTEAVWGLGCDPFNETAVMRLLELKQRPVDKGLILVASDLSQLAPLLEHLSQQQIDLLATPQPHPTTWLVPDPAGLIPFVVKGSHSPVAVRISQHPLVQRLCRAYGGVIVSTSANRSNQPAAKTRLALMQSFNMARSGMTRPALDYVLPGELGGYDQPSEIRDLVTNAVLRPGG